MNSVFRPPTSLSLQGNVAENWRKFKQRYLLFVDASGNGGTLEKTKIAMLLNLIGDDGLEVYNTFKYSTEEDKNSLAVVLGKFEQHCAPLKNVIFERYKFFSVVQKDGQNFDSFLTELKTTASTCEFAEDASLEESLIRDRIVLGVADKNVQERMLREPELTLKRATEFCRASEVSCQQVRMLQSKPVDAVNVRTPRNEAGKSKNENLMESKKNFQCKKCGYQHKVGSCPAYGKTCLACREKNHFARGCPNRKRTVNYVKCEDGDEGECSGGQPETNRFLLDSLEVLGQKTILVNALVTCKSWYETINVGGQQVKFKLDTGAEISVLPFTIYRGLNPKPVLMETKSVLVAFGNRSTFVPEGTVDVLCSSPNCKGGQKIEFVVVKADTIPLLGVDACEQLKLVQRVPIQSITREATKEDVLQRYGILFTGLGRVPHQHHIELRKDVSPVIHPPRRVPFSLHETLKGTLTDLQKRRIISPVSKPTEWVSSLVIVEKDDGSLRLCLDPKDLNRAVKREHFMIPTAEDLISKLNGRSVFTVIDMKEGFWQIELDEESADLCTFNTPFGRYRFNRLPYGLCSAPEVFQKRNNEIFADIDGCQIYFDDLIVAGHSIEEHDKILGQVFKRAEENNIRFNKEKFQFRVPEVKYVGRLVSGDGIRPDSDLVRAILKMSSPVDKPELLRFLGMTKYLSQYIPNLSQVTAPLRQLTKKNVDWQWHPEHDKAMQDLRTLLCRPPVLSIFDSSKPVMVQTDASQYGLGACLMQNGHPIYYASRALTPTEQRYAQIEKELLDIVFGVTKFHHFTYGRQVLVQTDHKPLVSIFMKVISGVSARLQRMLLQLLKYQLEVVYVPGKEMFLADTLSRSFLSDPVSDDPELKYIVHSLARHMPMTVERKKQFVDETQCDETLKNLMDLHAKGWPANKCQCPEIVRFFWNLRDKITVEEGLVFLGDRLIVPTKLRKYVLGKLHESHLGIEKTRLRAREVVYWPGMSTDIELKVSKCSLCQRYQSSNCKETMLSHAIPKRPWERLATDIFQFGTQDYLTVVDYYTRWIECVTIQGKTAGDVIAQLKSIFARYGVPDVLISDNMPFDSQEFKNFASDWGFNSVTSSPLHSQSNGLAEKSVSTVKNMLKKAHEMGQDIFVPLMEYRNTPIKDTGFSPAQLMLNRRIKTKIPACESLLQPETIRANVPQLIQESRRKARQWYDRGAKDLQQLNTGESVMIQKGKVWEPGQVVEGLSTPRSYIVQQTNGRQIRRNRRLLKHCANPPELTMNPELGMPISQPDAQNGTIQATMPGDSVVTKPPYITRSGRQVIMPARYLE